MRGWMLVGGFVGGLLACSASTGFACMEDSECTLSGEPGVCAAGNCAYPSETCESGYVYPDGAPGNLAGMCADVEGDTGSDPDTGPGESTGNAESSGETTVALDDGTTTGDDTTSVSTSVASSDGMESEAGEESSSGGCATVDVYLESVEDAFMSDSCPMMMGCELFNFGATSQYFVGENDFGDRSVMAIRFDAKPLIDLMIGQIQTAEVELYYELDNNEINGTFVVGALSPEYPWVEGDQSGSPASDGESCWDAAQYPDLPWPEGPTGAVVEELGQAALADMIGEETIVIPLDVNALTIQFVNGADSVLVYGSVDNLDIFVLSRESGLPPVLHLVGC